jgi:hypothetical protein
MAEELEKPGVAMERPSWLKKGDTRGTEHLTKADIQMPRLALAQGLSPQIQEGDPQQIQGLKVGMLFNSLTKEILGKGPLEFTIIRADPPRWVEFYPRTEGGGIKDITVPPNDPRTQFTTDNGKSVPPVATQFYDFVIMMLPVKGGDPMSNMIALSFKSTGLKVARQLNGLMRYRDAPSFTGKYILTTGMQRNPKGTFAVYQVANAGWVDEETGKLGEQMFDALKDREIKIDIDDQPDDAVEHAGGDAGFEVDPATNEVKM